MLSVGSRSYPISELYNKHGSYSEGEAYTNLKRFQKLCHDAVFICCEPSLSKFETVPNEYVYHSVQVKQPLYTIMTKNKGQGNRIPVVCLAKKKCKLSDTIVGTLAFKMCLSFKMLFFNGFLNKVCWSFGLQN